MRPTFYGSMQIRSIYATQFRHLALTDGESRCGTRSRLFSPRSYQGQGYCDIEHAQFFSLSITLFKTFEAFDLYFQWVTIRVGVDPHFASVAHENLTDFVGY